jgi:excisionase family DNA binding protein
MRKRRDVELVDLDDRLTITIQRTADVLDVGRSTVYELLRAGKLKGVKFGRAHRVIVQSMRDLIANSHKET